MTVETVVIFRLGSIGDTVNCLPCFHQIGRAFPTARRVLLTNWPVSSIAAPAESILRGGGFVHEVVRYTVGERDGRKLWALRRTLRALGGDTLIYLTEGRSLAANWRDWMFFRLCGFTRIVGAPLTADLAHGRRDPRTGEVEREVERLARCLAALGPLDLNGAANRDLNLTPQEKAVGLATLSPLAGAPFIAINTGGKVKVKDWGEPNWTALLGRLSAALPGCALVFVGAAEDSERASRLARAWAGPSLDLCGRLSPRESAAVLEHGRLFIGHDSGPLHLAAASGLACVAMFGDHNAPKKWHPLGDRHRIIHDMRGVMAITPDRVFDAAQDALSQAQVAP